MKSTAETAEQYLDELPEDRCAALSVVRDVINAHLPDGPLDILGETIGKIPVEEFVARHAAARGSRK